MPTGTCKLCLRTAELRKSHLIPDFYYRLIRDANSPNPNPIIVTRRRATPTSRQTVAHVLCGDCENLFSRNGERYTSQQVFNGTTFPLLNYLSTCHPAATLNGSQIFRQRETPNIRRRSLGGMRLFPTRVLRLLRTRLLLRSRMKRARAERQRSREKQGVGKLGHKLGHNRA